MAWFMRMRFTVLCLMLMLLGGCSSTIKKYDSTFTSLMPEASTTQIHALSVSSAPIPLKAKLISNRSKPYFIEFRARNALSYGHASVVFGMLDRNGNIPINGKGILIPEMVEISGLHPATPSSIPWSVGHVVPVPAETGPSDGDFEEQYVTARYRIDLTENEFRRVVAIVHKHKSLAKMWYAPLFNSNCLGYIRSIARDLNLRIPRDPEFPKEYVDNLKALNT